MSRRILTLDEVSERTGVPVNTLRFYRATRSGGPKTFKLGGRVVALEEDVDAWVSACYHAEDTASPETAGTAGSIRV